jgi:Zinc finger C-x8-C-x5-C-x3-H type (and similar)
VSRICGLSLSPGWFARLQALVNMNFRAAALSRPPGQPQGRHAPQQARQELCRFFSNNGSCLKGDACPFFHGVQESEGASTVQGRGPSNRAGHSTHAEKITRLEKLAEEQAIHITSLERQLQDSTAGVEALKTVQHGLQGSHQDLSEQLAYVLKELESRTNGHKGCQATTSKLQGRIGELEDMVSHLEKRERQRGRVANNKLESTPRRRGPKQRVVPVVAPHAWRTKYPPVHDIEMETENELSFRLEGGKDAIDGGRLIDHDKIVKLAKGASNGVVGIVIHHPHRMSGAFTPDIADSCMSLLQSKVRVVVVLMIMGAQKLTGSTQAVKDALHKVEDRHVDVDHQDIDEKVAVVDLHFDEPKQKFLPEQDGFLQLKRFVGV